MPSVRNDGRILSYSALGRSGDGLQTLRNRRGNDVHCFFSCVTGSSRDERPVGLSGIQREIELDVRDSEADWTPPKAAPEGAPNILFVLYDDTGLGAWSPYGGKINMPTLDALAAEGLTYDLAGMQWRVGVPLGENDLLV